MKTIALAIPKSAFSKLEKLAQPQGNLSKTFHMLLKETPVKNLRREPDRIKRTALWLSDEDVAELDKIVRTSNLRSRNEAAALIIKMATQDNNEL